MTFEISKKDLRARIGRFDTPHGEVKTPTLLPVINPNHQIIPAKEMEKFGAEILITNSYIIYRNHGPVSAHKLIGWDGPLMTDSGSFQLMQYGDVEVDNETIIDFQRQIGSDIGVILDIPTFALSHKKTHEALMTTLERAKAERPKDVLWAGPIQGAQYMDLVEQSSKEMAKLPFFLHPIGSVVPTMQQYRYELHARTIQIAKAYLPEDRPVHFFGAGHPMTFALFTALGCDLFDSAAYSLFAKKGKYMTEISTLDVKELREFPCCCPACTSTTPKDMSERELASHNLHTSFSEIRKIREAIREGTLGRLLMKRARSHPMLLYALKRIDFSKIAPFSPRTKKSGFFYLGPESLRMPEVLTAKRYAKERFYKYSDTMVVLPESLSYSEERHLWDSHFQYSFLHPVFGLVPLELKDMYPFSQVSYPLLFDKEQYELDLEVLKKFKHVRFVRSKDTKGFWDEPFDYSHSIINHIPHVNLEDEIPKDPGRDEKDFIRKKLSAMSLFQFGADAFENPKPQFSRTGRMRFVEEGGKRTATIRAYDNFIIPSKELSRRLFEKGAPAVIAKDDAVPFVKKGKSLFSKFVKDTRGEFHPQDEVAVCDSSFNFISCGTALLSRREMLEFSRGIAVDTR
jgi:7-cyano-7-deazaguanine tRNA-ribosyltransferase